MILLLLLLFLSFLSSSVFLLFLTFSDDLENRPVTPTFSLSRGSKRLLRSRPFLDLCDQEVDEDEDDDDDDNDDGPVTLKRCRITFFYDDWRQLKVS